METNSREWPPAIDFLNPLAGWEAAARWQAASFDWMAKGWQQWLALLTTVPPQFLVPPSLEPHHALPTLAHAQAADEAADARPRAHETRAIRTRARAEPRRKARVSQRRKPKGDKA